MSMGRMQYVHDVFIKSEREFTLFDHTKIKSTLYFIVLCQFLIDGKCYARKQDCRVTEELCSCNKVIKSSIRPFVCNMSYFLILLNICISSVFFNPEQCSILIGKRVKTQIVLNKSIHIGMLGTTRISKIY